MQAAIKRNKLGSFVERQMNPESVIQSKVRKRKNKYHILTHPCGNLETWYRSVVPNLFGTKDGFCGRQFFHGPEVGDGFQIIQALYNYCALYYISFTSDNQASDPRG